MTVPFRFEWKHDGTLHGDVHVTVGTFQHCADAYYFAIDSGIDARQTGPKKVVKVMRAMLGEWERIVRAMKKGGVELLPFDFSDQCTGWLRVERAAGDRVTMRAGWSLLEGWAFNPSAFEGVRPGDFKDMPGSQAVECSLRELVESIQQSSEALNGAKSKPAKRRRR